MPRPRKPHDWFADCPAAVEALREAQWTFGRTDGGDIHELRVRLASPAVITAAKANIPVPGLPTLDGFLSFVAFRAAFDRAVRKDSSLASAVLWQWNAALRNPVLWLDFELPLRQVTLDTATIYDCSIGLPVVSGDPLIPAGGFFAHHMDLVTYPAAVDSLALRRRVSPPVSPYVELCRELKTSSGSNKALDNRMYYALTEEFRFYFRGDEAGTERLLQFACEQRIGIGKKTTLGYGQIRDYCITTARAVPGTFALPILAGQSLALVKSLPYAAALAARTNALPDLFGCREFRLMNALETLGAYRPPYWRRETQTHVLLYGSTVIPQ